MLYNLFENRDFVSVFAVALLAEGVDRNYSFPTWQDAAAASPSSRRAWIEIILQEVEAKGKVVALLAEGVDRNVKKDTFTPVQTVALLAEGVDRNKQLTLTDRIRIGRPPRGGRG